jgi:hypothetical protein
VLAMVDLSRPIIYECRPPSRGMVDVGSEAGLGNDGDHVIDLDVSRLSGGVRPGAPHMLEIGSAICGFCSTIHMYAFS